MRKVKNPSLYVHCNKKSSRRAKYLFGIHLGLGQIRLGQTGRRGTRAFRRESMMR